MEKERRGSEGGYEESGPLWKMIESLGFLEKEGPSPQLDQLPKLKAKAQVCGQALFFLCGICLLHLILLSRD